ncbi:hypothetical protein DXA17_19120 [Ruminococcus sp. AM58-7XD]|nr:hypothetical protein DXA17_19120 [Ruminococcus sp. AM58-7XD]
MTREIFSRNECKIKIYVVDEKCYVYIEYYSATRLVDEKCYVYIEYYSATRLVVQTGRFKRALEIIVLKASCLEYSFKVVCLNVLITDKDKMNTFNYELAEML